MINFTNLPFPSRAQCWALYHWASWSHSIKTTPCQRQTPFRTCYRSSRDSVLGCGVFLSSNIMRNDSFGLRETLPLVPGWNQRLLVFPWMRSLTHHIRLRSLWQPDKIGGKVAIQVVNLLDNCTGRVIGSLPPLKTVRAALRRGCRKGAEKRTNWSHHFSCTQWHPRQPISFQ